MLFKNVMVPYDGSDHAIRALDTAAKLIADDPNAKIHVVNVIATSDFTPKYGNSNPFWHPYDSMDEASYARLITEAKDSAVADLRADLLWPNWATRLRSTSSPVPERVRAWLITPPITSATLSSWAAAVWAASAVFWAA